MEMTPQHFHTIPTSCAIHVANYAHHKTLYMHLAYSYALNEEGTQLCYSTVFQWRSQSAANARAHNGHIMFASSLVPRSRPAFSRLQYGNAEATRRVWGLLPHKILEFLSFLARSGATLGHTVASNWSTSTMPLL